MTFLAIIAAAVLAHAQDPTELSAPQGVAEPTRLALTPVLDGAIRADEWDFFARSNEGETFFQWEPGKLHFAGRFKADHDLVVSLDLNQDGWLIGKDNLEIRIRHRDGQSYVVGRQLDATGANGPRWIDLPKLTIAAKVAGSENNGECVVEASVIDPGIDLLPIRNKDRFRIRMDVVAQSAQVVEPFVPRNGTLVRLAMERASAMPVGLDWKVEEPGRAVAQGRKTNVRFSFGAKTDPGVRKIEVKPMGVLGSHASTLTSPFPQFKRGRAFVDYDASIDGTAPTGYHLVTSTLFSADGIPSMIQASIRVAPLVDFTLVEDRIKLKMGVQQFKVPFYIESNSNLRLDGQYEVELPSQWSTSLGNEKRFVIYNSRASVRRVLTIRTPADAAGTYPIRFRASIGEKKFFQVVWVTVVRS